ncbi:MAG: hypothetical protein ACAI44_24560 [Candidatus Sericytochromatia bacterium]
MYRQILSCLMGGLLLTGCMERMSHEPSQDPAGAQALIENFAQVLATPKTDANVEKLMALTSLPFYFEEWHTDADVLMHKLSDNLMGDFPGHGSLLVRVYPLEDLSVLIPKRWEELKANTPKLFLKDLFLGVAAVKIKGTDTMETGYVLLRRVEGRWKLAGLIEK